MSKLESYYVDHVGYGIEWSIGYRDMTVATSGEIYHHYNGLMLMVVF